MRRYKTVQLRLARGTCVLLGVSMTLAACSSSKKASTATNPGGSGTTAAAGSGGSSQVAAAQAAVQAASQSPTAIPLTTPLSSAPPKGKTFVWLQCDISQCKDEADGLSAATAAVGWNLKVHTYQSGNPATLISAMDQALTDNPVAVALSGLPQALWQTEVPKYKAANVPIVVGYVGPQALDSTILANIGGPSYVGQVGKDIGNWFIADSNGKGKTLSVQVNDFPILKNFSDSLTSTITNGCSGCSVTPLNITIAQVAGGQIIGAIVSALQKDPSINYVITCNGPFIDGLPSALGAAGLSGKIRIAGESGDVENLTDVKNSTEQAFTGLALHYGAWAMVDAAIRHVENLPIPANEGDLPLQLFTKTSQFDISNSFDKPADYQAQFKKLWQV